MSARKRPGWVAFVFLCLFTLFSTVVLVNQVQELTQYRYTRAVVTGVEAVGGQTSANGSVEHLEYQDERAGVQEVTKTCSTGTSKASYRCDAVGDRLDISYTPGDPGAGVVYGGRTVSYVVAAVFLGVTVLSWSGLMRSVLRRRRGAQVTPEAVSGTQ